MTRRRFKTLDEHGNLVATIDVLALATDERRTLELSADIPGISVRVAVFHPAVEMPVKPRLAAA